MADVFVYHAKPAEMIGETLYPLEQLAGLEPERYRREFAKYDDHPDRQLIPTQYIAGLACQRQAVLNFAPVHPYLIYRAWRDLGVTLPPQSWFRIPVSRLARLPAVVTLPDAGRTAGRDLPVDAVSTFDAARYRELSGLPEATLRWYAQLVRQRRRGGWFVGVPHILVRGEVSVAGLTSLDWSVPIV